MKLTLIILSAFAAAVDGVASKEKTAILTTAASAPKAAASAPEADAASAAPKEKKKTKPTAILANISRTVTDAATREEADAIRHHHKKHHHKAKRVGKDFPTGGPNSPQNTKGLEKTTNEQFYGPPHPGDYQADQNPHVPSENDRLDYPYPAYKDPKDFDRDFVEDSDSDGGAWDAQMEYDRLRAKVQKSQDEVNVASEKLEKEQLALDEAEEEEGVKEAMKDKWDHEFEMREEEKESLEIRVKSKVDAANAASAEVEKRTQELQQAERELQEATKRLEESQQELKEAEEGIQGLGEARRAVADAKEKLDAAREDSLAAGAVVAEKRKARDTAAEQLRKEEQDVNRVQAEADYARLRLAKYARGSADKQGDVGGIYRAGASTLSVAVFAWFMLI